MDDGIKATLQVLEAGGSSVTKTTGKPKVSALEAILERDVTQAERDEWYEEATKVTENGGVEPAAPPAGTATRKVRTSGLGGW